MSHIYFIHREDIPVYRAHQEAIAPFQKEQDEIYERAAADPDNFDFCAALDELNKRAQPIHDKYKYRCITLMDDGYGTARKRGYVGFYCGFQWDE